MERQQQRSRTVAAMATIVLGVTGVLPGARVHAGDRLSAAFSHTCGLRSNGSPVCWGENSSGETTVRPGTYVQVSSGEIDNCARRPDGTLGCWGFSYLQPGGTPQPTGTYRQVSVSGLHTCALDANSVLTCWGEDGFGQAPNDMLLTLNTVDAGYRHTCGVDPTGTVWCWGDPTDAKLSPVNPDDYSQVSAGGTHSCGLHTGGTIECWGLNNVDQATPPLGTFVEVQAGFLHSCARRVDGTVACWGADNASQVSDTPTTTAFAEISAGYFHNCGIVLETGAIDCWGDDQFGQASALPGDYRAATAQAALTSLAGQVTALGGTVSKPLLASMTGASIRLNDGNPANDRAACGKLGATRNKLAEFVATDRIDDATGLSLIGQTVAIRNQIGC